MQNLLLGSLIWASLMTTFVMAETRLLEWGDLKGWQEDTHEEALSVFQETCRDLKQNDWPTICAVSKTVNSPREFFESFFLPVLTTEGEEPLFTGYYEPEFPGSRVQSEEYDVPLYSLPPEADIDGRWLSREEIENTDVLRNRGLELAWLKSPVDKFFLQIQGSGRVILQNGDVMRLGFGGQNGHPYRSVGREMVRRGIFQEHQVSAQTIRNWVESNPIKGNALLNHNPSYVFFRRVDEVPKEKGPLGAMNRSITAGRSIAIDPKFVPLGAPAWVEMAGAEPINRLMVAQDTGAAVKGAQRADIFFGTGEKAGIEAGRIRNKGRLIVLMPIEEALKSASR